MQRKFFRKFLKKKPHFQLGSHPEIKEEAFKMIHDY